MTRGPKAAKNAGTSMERRTADYLAEHVCIGCGGALPAQRLGQPRKWCSDSCRSETYRDSRRKGIARRSLGERLAAKLASEGDCLVFTGHRNEHGYGVIRSDDGRTMLAHRAAYAVLVGPIPPGMHVLHSCDNPPCCNPQHLRVGTHEDNMRDRDVRGRTLRGDALRMARWGR